MGRVRTPRCFPRASRSTASHSAGHLSATLHSKAGVYLPSYAASLTGPLGGRRAPARVCQAGVCECGLDRPQQPGRVLSVVTVRRSNRGMSMSAETMMRLPAGALLELATSVGIDGFSRFRCPRTLELGLMLESVPWPATPSESHGYMNGMFLSHL